jgi:transcriptional regulator with XRE-family HTH domain
MHRRMAGVSLFAQPCAGKSGMPATIGYRLNERISEMAKASTNRRGPTAVDSHVGQKIRARRIFLGMSQTEVADAVGITFQQIQKYERGANRVGASRLQQISDALGVSPFYFFDGAPTVGKKMPAQKDGELSEGAILSFLATREGATLVRGFLAIEQKTIRSNVIEFISTLKGR